MRAMTELLNSFFAIGRLVGLLCVMRRCLHRANLDSLGLLTQVDRGGFSHDFRLMLSAR